MLVYDPVAANGNMSRASLFTLGYRNIELVLSLEALRYQIGRAHV
mgnify:CR=1 FL=1